MKVAVFGAGGPIGSAITAELLARGYMVTAVTRSGTPIEGLVVQVATGDAADDAAVHRVALRHRLPRVRLQLLDAQRDALLDAVELENLDVDVLAHLQHLRRMRDPAVGHVD